MSTAAGRQLHAANIPRKGRDTRHLNCENNRFLCFLFPFFFFLLINKKIRLFSCSNLRSVAALCAIVSHTPRAEACSDKLTSGSASTNEPRFRNKQPSAFNNKQRAK